MHLINSIPSFPKNANQKENWDDHKILKACQQIFRNCVVFNQLNSESGIKIVGSVIVEQKL